ncbi:MAG: DUF6079 family protein [Thermodesulfobacteriota bacterium]|nr:DUF6079 family protein [Thermodesulfobacteriota bacterium]
MNRSLKIRDLIEVPQVQTVIRLEEGRTHSESILSSFVLTSDVASHFEVIADALLKNTGRGFFLQGDFGSGKSHFLATLTAWLAGNQGSQILSGSHDGLRRVKDSNRKFLPVDISLINFRGTTSLEKIIVEAVESTLALQGVQAQLTPLSAFLDNLRSLLEDAETAAAFAKHVGISGENRQEIIKYLQNHPRKSYTRGISFMKSLGIKTPEALVEDRHETFDRALIAVKDAGFNGLVLIIDELSEFFRSKTDARALNEDARTLQFIGELAGSKPVWIIAAVQESIERTGDIAQVTFRKIKDRFPVKLVLSTLHIKSLISERLVIKKDIADKELTGIYEYFQKQFPSFNWSCEDFLAFYPVHPATIELLDGLGDLFSVHRGIVDFVHSQIAGDKSRLISGILDRPCYELLGPDSIYEHFSQRIAEISAFNAYSKNIIPHLDEVIKRTIDEPEDRALARRIIRILVLYKIHPTADIPKVKELTQLVACALSDQDPDINVQFVAEAILDTIVEESRFLVKLPSKEKDPFNDVYTIVTQEDPGKALKAKILRAASEIPENDSRLLTEPFSELPESISWPGTELSQSGVYRYIVWRNSLRKVFVPLFNPSLSNHEEDISLNNRITDAFAAEDADFAVVISLGKIGFSLENTAVWEVLCPSDEKEVTILREFLAAKQILSELKPSHPADKPLIQVAKETVSKLRDAAHRAAINAIFSGNYADERITVEPAIRQYMKFDRLLDEAGRILLENRYPRFREIEPRKASPSARMYQTLLDEFISKGTLSLREAHSRQLSNAIDGLATPLGLVELKAGSYVFAPDPENHPLLSTLFRLINTAGKTGLSDVLLSLRKSDFGLPVDTACFLMAALAFGGLIALIKNGRAMALDFIRITKVEDADTIAPGEVIGKHDRETLINECGFLSPSKGWESFGLRQQREAWQETVKFRDQGTRLVTDMEKRLSSIREFSAFEAFDLKSLKSQLNALINLVGEIKVSYPAREGLEQFLKAWRSSGFNSNDIIFLKKMQTFLVKYADQFIFINHYIRHSAVDRAASEKEEIKKLQNSIKQLLNQPDSLVMDENTSFFTESFERFRAVYADFYKNEHDKYYSLFKTKPLSRFAKRALMLLKRLASIETLDRPARLGSLFRKLEVPKDAVCKRNVSEELMRSPVCNCGFIPGEAQMPFQTEDPEKAIEKHLDQYLLILKNPAVREAISARIFALTDSDPDTVSRLRSLNSFLSDETSSSGASGLLDMLDDAMAGEISKSLSGRIAIEKRGVKDLVSSLGGRRLAPNQVHEVIKKWISIDKENTVVAIEDDIENISKSRFSSHSWWAIMHPALFKEDAGREIRDIEASLERQYPSSELRSQFLKLNDKNLLLFLINEPFHSMAVRMAWLLFSERILSGAPWPRGYHKIPVPLHADRETAVKIRKQIETLHKISMLLNAPFPDALRVRIPLSKIQTDSWTTSELRSFADEIIYKTGQTGEEWLSTLAETKPIDLQENPIVLILDGVSPDVWLEAMDDLKLDAVDMKHSWFRLEVAPQTPSAVSSLFGFSGNAGDATDEFHSRGVEYNQVKGNEEHGLSALLPVFSPDKPAVILVSLVDAGAHAAILRLSEMPEAVCTFLGKELPGLIDICNRQKRRLVVTTDHGLSLTKKGLAHGKGGVFERAIFRMDFLP